MTPLVSSLFLAGALRGSLEIGDRTEARVTGTTNPSTYSAEVMTNPSAFLRLDMRRWEISVRYGPSLTLRGIGIEPALDIIHQGTLAAFIEASRRLRLSIAGDASYGTIRLLSPALPETGFTSVETVDSLPGQDTVDFASLDVSVGGTFIASRRLSLEAVAGYRLSGGVGGTSQDLYPQVGGPRVHVTADIALTRKDRARSAADATWVTFSTGEESMVAQLTETWVHRFTRATASTLGLGAALDFSRPSAGAAATAIYPVTQAGLTHELPEKRLVLGLGASVEPVIDRVGGEVESRLLLDASATYQASPRMSVWGRTGAAQSIPWSEPDSLTLAFGEAGFGVRLADWVELVNGTRAAYQFRSETEPRRLQWMIFSGATFTAPAVRF